MTRQENDELRLKKALEVGVTPQLVLQVRHRYLTWLEIKLLQLCTWYVARIQRTVEQRRLSIALHNVRDSLDPIEYETTMINGKLVPVRKSREMKPGVSTVLVNGIMPLDPDVEAMGVAQRFLETP
jgi:hypothetical protein